MMTLAEYLSSHPPGKPLLVCKAGKNVTASFLLAFPTIELFCENHSCQGVRFFDTSLPEQHIYTSIFKELFATYTCRHCKQTQKKYAILAKGKESDMAEVIKLGEWPGFGPHTPAKVISLIGGDRDLFLVGRRAESQGMGIGAFSYYRRVVESQKSRIFDEVI
jgi:hypothetical protein